MATRFLNEAEEDFARDFPCINHRVALDIVSGTADYTLPDYTLSIRRITWKGRRVEPLNHREFRNKMPPTSSGAPYWYVFNNVGQLKIKLYPTPNETLATTTSNLYDTNIPLKCIVEMFRLPDFSTYRIPAFLRTRLIEDYDNAMEFAIEGVNKNLKLSKYFMQAYLGLKEIYGEALNDVLYRSRKLTANGQTLGHYPKDPVLPLDRFGISVDE